MSLKAACIVAVIALCWAASGQADANDEEAPLGACPSVLSNLGTGLTKKNETRSFACIDSWKATFKDPNAISHLLNTYFTSDHGVQFLKDINFEFRVFDASNEAESNSLGFKYDYAKTLNHHDLTMFCGDHDHCTSGLNLSFVAKGNVAFDDEINPTDFLETKLHFDFFHSRGGVTTPTDEALTDINDLRTQFIAAEDEEVLESLTLQIMDVIQPYLSDQYYWSIGIDASLESNQRFTAKHYVYAVTAGLDLKGWGRSSALGKFNLIEYPFALIRGFTGYDGCAGPTDCFEPRGASFPTFVARFGRVETDGEDPRALVDTSDFDRFDVEVSFNTPIAQVGEQTLYAAMSYRYFKERSASRAVKDADLDSFDYFSASLRLDDGIVLTFSNGRLPFDVDDQQVVSIGWELHL